MGRRARLKISESDFQMYLLENYIDSAGDKVSDRELWSSDEFIEKTGLFKKDKFSTKKLMVSMGTVSYWKKKLEITEESIFHYHTVMSKRLKPNADFEKWSRKNNAGHSKKKQNDEKTRRANLVKILNLDSNFKKYSVDIIMNYMRDIWKLSNLDVEAETSRIMNLLDSIEVR